MFFAVYGAIFLFPVFPPQIFKHTGPIYVYEPFQGMLSAGPTEFFVTQRYLWVWEREIGSIKVRPSHSSPLIEGERPYYYNPLTENDLEIKPLPGKVIFRLTFRGNNFRTGTPIIQRDTQVITK